MWNLQFNSLQQLFWMNGHGPYVWGAYALALVAIIFLVWSPLARRRRFLNALQAAERRARAAEQSSSQPGKG